MVTSKTRPEGLLWLLVVLLISSYAAGEEPTQITPADGERAAGEAQVEANALESQQSVVTGCTPPAAGVDLAKEAQVVLEFARCLQQQGRVASARRHFLMVHQALPETDPRRKDALSLAADLAQRTPRLHIKAQDLAPGTQVFCNNKELTFGGKQVVKELDPGQHLVKVKAPGRKTLVYAVNLLEGRVKTVVIETGPPRNEGKDTPGWSPQLAGARGIATSLDPTAEQANPTLAYSVLGAGALTASVGAYFGLRAHSQQTEAEQLCSAQPTNCSEHLVANQLQEKANTKRWVANVAVPAGLAGVVTGIYLLFRTKKSKEKQVGVKPWVGYTNVGAMLNGTW